VVLNARNVRKKGQKEET